MNVTIAMIDLVVALLLVVVEVVGVMALVMIYSSVQIAQEHAGGIFRHSRLGRAIPAPAR